MRRDVLYLFIQLPLTISLLLSHEVRGFSSSLRRLQSHVHARPHTPSQQRPWKTSTLFPGDDSNNNDENESPASIDEILDKPFFDPDAFDDDDDSILGKLAAFVKSDYELAETIYVGIIFVIMVIVSQELLRMQIYGDSYVPFHSSGSPANSGRLF